MTRWSWRHAEFRVHDGWVPKVNLHVGGNGKAESATLGADPSIVLDTKAAARDENRRLVATLAAERGWTLVPADNEAP